MNTENLSTWHGNVAVRCSTNCLYYRTWTLKTSVPDMVMWRLGAVQTVLLNMNTENLSTWHGNVAVRCSTNCLYYRCFNFIIHLLFCKAKFAVLQEHIQPKQPDRLTTTHYNTNTNGAHMDQADPLEQKRTASMSWIQQLKSQSLTWELDTDSSLPTCTNWKPPT